MEYYCHESSIIDPGASIGKGTKVWHFSHIMGKAQIGNNCTIGQNVFIADNVVIKDGVKIQNNVSIYDGVIIEKDVFIGPSVVFTNVKNPRSFIERKTEFRQSHVLEGCSIGANATIVCGTTLGAYSFIAAGATVTKNVPDYALVTGLPAILNGWMCVCGTRLIFDNSKQCSCNNCNSQYELDQNGECIKLDLD